MAIGGGNGDRRKLAEERLMRGRKIDQMRGRKKELCTARERERGNWELVQRGERKNA